MLLGTGDRLGGRLDVVYKREERSHQDLLSLLRMKTEMKRGQSRTDDETAGLDLEKGKLASLLCGPTCFSSSLGWRIPRKCLLEVGTKITR